jgi:hypothetical protein
MKVRCRFLRRFTRYDAVLAGIPTVFVAGYLLASASISGGTVALGAAALASGVIILAGLFYDPPAPVHGNP